MNARTCLSYTELEKTGNTCLAIQVSFLHFFIIIINILARIAQSPRAFTSFSVQPLYLLFLFIYTFLCFITLLLLPFIFNNNNNNNNGQLHTCKMSFNKSNAANFTLSLLNINVSVKYKIIYTSTHITTSYISIFAHF